MNKVSIGDFTVDLDERRIFKFQQELPAEPKIIEVLCFLIKHHDRFISLKELHDNVWSGRIVTDTAVRRTISKLRVLLDDNDPDKPRFIKSQMKRGYQIINVKSGTTTVEPITNVVNSLTTRQLNSSRAKHVLSRRIYTFIVIFFIALVGVMVYYNAIYTKTNYPENMQLTSILDVPGEKFGLTVSSDGRYQAFTARLNNSEKWQAYLYDSSTGLLNRLILPGDLVYSISFLGNKLAVVSYTDGVGSLYINSSESLLSDFERVEFNRFSLIDKVVPLDANTLLINAAENHQSAFLYYVLNLVDLSISQFSYSNNNNVKDYGGVMSSDGAQLAFIRWDKGSKKHVIQIYRIKTKDLVVEWPFTVTTNRIALAWVSATDLILTTPSEIRRLNIKKGFENKPVSYHNVSELAKDSQGNIFGILNDTDNLQVYETSIPYSETFNRRFELGDAVKQFYYSNIDNDYKYWLIEYLNGQYSLSNYVTDTKVKTLVFQSEQFFRILDQAINSPYLLLRHGWQLQVLNTKTGLITPVSIKTQSIENAAFNIDASKVYFSENMADSSWRINEFELSSGLQTPIVDGYRAVLPYKNEFLSVTELGDIWLLDTRFAKKLALPFTLNMRHVYRLFIREDTLVTLNRLDSSDWQLSVYNFIDQSLSQNLIKSNQLGAEVSINSEGDKVLFVKDKVYNSKLVSFRL